MSRRAAMYGALAAAGLVLPWYFNIRYIAEGGSLIDIPAALRLAFANPISSSFSADLLVAFVAFTIWSVIESRRIAIRYGWVYPLIGLFVGFAFAFPLFLLRREMQLRT